MGGFYKDLRKHEGAVPARVNEVFALLYGGEHLECLPMPSMQPTEIENSDLVEIKMDYRYIANCHYKWCLTEL